MKIKWYWLAEQLGVMEDISTGTEIAYRVSVKADEYFETAIFSLVPLLFLAGLFLAFLLGRRQREILAGKLTLGGIGILVIYGLLLATGIGPYIQFYPQPGGFSDLSPITNILSGLYCGFLALLLFLGSRLGRWLARRTVSK